MTFKFTCGLLLGAGLGALITHYLNTREGRELVDRVKDDAEAFTDNLKEMSDNLVAKARSVMGKGGEEEEMLGAETIVVVGVGPDPLSGSDQAR